LWEWLISNRKNLVGETIQEQVVSATFILVDESDFQGMNEEWVKWFPKDPPARQGAKLPISPAGMRISIAVIAEA
jgi:2-iminobutanoate/2-iminopropanoate deaminase